MIPVSKPHLTQLELNYVSDAIKSGWVSSLGEYIERFEDEFARFCGAKYALTVSNGTVGLHLALVANGIGAGDEVIIPDLTFVATANAVKMANAMPVMVDVCRDTYCINHELLNAAITENTKAVIPVHLYGHPANMNAISEVAKEHNLKIIEDAAEAHGASIDGMRVGAIGDCGVFSFYGNKIITTGEGGMIVTNSHDLYERLRFLRDHAMSKQVRYWHTELGFNYRMTNIQAALGLAQLEQIEGFLAERAAQLTQYQKFLNNHGIECNPSVNAETVNWLTCAVVEGLDREKRDQIIARLHSKKIDSRPFFFPVSSLPMYSNKHNPISEALSQKGINLPTFIGLKTEEIEIICNVFVDAVRAILKK